MDEYYLIEATLSTGVSKWLICSDSPEHGLVVYDRWDDKIGALAMVEYLNREK